jgi:hypothetical protein
MPISYASTLGEHEFPGLNDSAGARETTAVLAATNASGARVR